EVLWIVKVQSEGSRNFNSAWFAKSNGGLLIKSVQEVNNYNGDSTLGTVTPTGDIYRLGDFNANQAKYYLITADVIDCEANHLYLKGGYSCESNDYPATIPAAQP